MEDEYTTLTIKFVVILQHIVFAVEKWPLIASVFFQAGALLCYVAFIPPL